MKFKTLIAFSLFFSQFAVSAPADMKILSDAISCKAKGSDFSKIEKAVKNSIVGRYNNVAGPSMYSLKEPLIINGIETNEIYFQRDENEYGSFLTIYAFSDKSLSDIKKSIVLPKQLKFSLSNKIPYEISIKNKKQ